jgi:hypothetical protein
MVIKTKIINNFIGIRTAIRRPYKYALSYEMSVIAKMNAHHEET